MTVKMKIFIFNACCTQTESALNLREQRRAWDTMDLVKMSTCQSNHKLLIFFPAFWEWSFGGVITPPEQQLCSPTKTNEPSASKLHSWTILLWLKSKHILDHLMMEVVGLSNDLTTDEQNGLAGLRPPQEIVWMQSVNICVSKATMLQIWTVTSCSRFKRSSTSCWQTSRLPTLQVNQNIFFQLLVL